MPHKETKRFNRYAGITCSETPELNRHSFPGLKLPQLTTVDEGPYKDLELPLKDSGTPIKIRIYAPLNGPYSLDELVEKVKSKFMD